jgi:hypothetical protein
MAEPAIGWFPVFTLILGYLTKSVSDWLLHRRTLERDRETRDAARRDQLFERGTTFQRQTLLDLQETLMQLGRTTGAMYHHDMMEYRKMQQWHRSLFPSELSENNRLSVARTSMLAVRVRDASVREMVDTFKNEANAVIDSGSPDSAEAGMRRMMETFEKTNQRIGELLRQIDDESKDDRIRQ